MLIAVKICAGLKIKKKFALFSLSTQYKLRYIWEGKDLS